MMELDGDHSLPVMRKSASYIVPQNMIVLLWLSNVLAWRTHQNLLAWTKPKDPSFAS